MEDRGRWGKRGGKGWDVRGRGRIEDICSAHELVDEGAVGVSCLRLFRVP